MKKSTYLILLMVICIGVKGQDTLHLPLYFDTVGIPILYTSEWRLQEYDESYVSLFVDENHDTTYTVYGEDSLTAIKQLFKEWSLMNKEVDKLQKAFDKMRNILSSPFPNSYPQKHSEIIYSKYVHVDNISHKPFDSTSFYRNRYKKYLALRSKANNQKDILRYSDSLLKYAELINRKK